jgi:hypothetical protein
MSLNNDRYNSLFSKIAQKTPILNQKIEEKRLNTEIKAAFPSPRYPKVNSEINLLNQSFLEENEYEIFKKTIEKSTLYNINKNLLLTDKISPHGLLEVMIISSDENIKSGIFDMEKQDTLECLRIFLKFIDFAKKKQLYPHISFSYDPYTNDRQSGQSVKRFHSHLVARTNQEIEEINTNKVKLGNLDLFKRRRIIDETSIVGSYILYDILSQNKNYKLFEVKKPFEEFGLPNLILKLKNGWGSLIDLTFISEIEDLHNSIINTYNLLLGLITEGENKFWERVKLKKDLSNLIYLKNSLNISEETFEMVLFMLERFKTSLLDKANNLNNKDLNRILEYTYPLSGPCYSISFFEKNDSVYVNVRPFIFSSIGGAGIIPIDGIITQIQRGSQVMSNEQIEQRRSFQREFVNSLKRI